MQESSDETIAIGTYSIDASDPIPGLVLASPWGISPQLSRAMFSNNKGAARCCQMNLRQTRHVGRPFGEVLVSPSRNGYMRANES